MLPLLLSKSDKNKKDNVLVLAGDVGATKTNLALFKMNGDGAVMLKEGSYPSQQYQNITEITDNFLKGQPRPEACCIGVAGPVFNGKVQLTNLSWEMDRSEIAKHFKLEKIYLINDLEANAYGLAMLTDKDL